MSNVFFIAEAGINHNGDLNIAKALMKLAKESGSDSVKFQKRTPEICVPHKMKTLIRSTPWGEMTYLDYKNKIEFGFDEFKEIDRYARDLDIIWSASAWDLPSLEFLDYFDLKYNKIASAMTTNKKFIKEVACRKKLTYASTGMCTWEEIDYLVETFSKANCPLVLMHTVSTYPASESDLNLQMIITLKKRYGLKVGYSGHEVNVSPSIIAAVLGADAIERHITLDRAMWGTDHSASLEKVGLELLINSIRKIPIIIGDGSKTIVAGEAEVAQKLRYWN